MNKDQETILNALLAAGLEPGLSYRVDITKFEGLEYPDNADVIANLSLLKEYGALKQAVQHGASVNLFDIEISPRSFMPL
jgi:hypothetical protein